MLANFKAVERTQSDTSKNKPIKGYSQDLESADRRSMLQRAPINANEEIQNYCTAKQSYSRDVGIIVANKIKKLKITVLPTNTQLYIVVPSSSNVTVSEIERNLRLRL